MNRAFDLPLLVSSKLSKYLISFKVQACAYFDQGQLGKMALEQVGLAPCQLFYFFFAAFTGFFAFAFLTAL
jgi:hypothetical protein